VLLSYNIDKNFFPFFVANIFHLDIAKNIIHLNKEFNQSYIKNNILIEQVNQILYGERSVEQQWEIMYRTFNDVHTGLANKIRMKQG